MARPGTTLLEQDDTHRLIPARYSEGDTSVLARIAGDKKAVQDLFELEGATNDRSAGGSQSSARHHRA